MFTQRHMHIYWNASKKIDDVGHICTITHYVLCGVEPLKAKYPLENVV